MDTVVLVIHLMLALAIIGLVLIQRSSGGGLGIGGGGGGMGDFATARSTANILTKTTTICAILFFCTSLTLGILAKGEREDTSGKLFSEEAAQAEQTKEELEGLVGESIDLIKEKVEEQKSKASDIPDIPTSDE